MRCISHHSNGHLGGTRCASTATLAWASFAPSNARNLRSPVNLITHFHMPQGLIKILQEMGRTLEETIRKIKHAKTLAGPELSLDVENQQPPTPEGVRG